jgi:SnoaL-like polyketide cyclase.
MNPVQKQIIENYVKSYNNFDVDGMIHDLADDMIFENFSNGNSELRIEGKEAFKHQAERAKQYFKNRNQKIESWEFKEEKVIIEVAFKATLAIDLPDRLKAGDTLELKGISIFIFENEKIKSIVDKS